ncbi:MAG: GAF domain-containing protein, partial [Anaerolineales bacterium]|nr:GAF domain-containing protein [Anaerolineales bacterium]
GAFKSVFRGSKAEESAPPSAVPASAPVEPSPPASPAEPATPATTDDQDRLAALYRVTRVLGTSLDVDEVLGQVIESVINLTGAERGLLVMVEQDSKEWNLKVARNFDPDKLSNWEAEISRTIINTAMDTRQGVVTADAMTDPRFSGQQSVVFNVLRSMMCAPLLARNRLIGAIYVDSRIHKGVFDESDLELLDTFATQAAFAIDNARIYTKTVQKVQQLTIELDHARMQRQVKEITETEYFQQLQARIGKLRGRGKRSEEPADEEDASA